jgi:hypothetical protein
MENNGMQGAEAAPGSQQNPAMPGPTPPAEPGRRGRRRYRYRSLFWPLVLIGAGVIWLLYSFGVLSASNLAIVGLVWPVFVIGIGVDLLLGHRSPLAGAAVAVVTLAVVVVLIAIGPGLGWVGSTALKTETFTTPVGEATSAQVELGLSGYTTTVHALAPATGADRDLLSANITHRGSIDFTAEGVTTKSVELRATNGWQWWQRIGNDTENPWDIGLAPGVPLSLIVLASSGSNTVDLTGLQMQKLEVDASSGDSVVVLPVADPLSATRPDIQLQTSSGRMEVQAPAGSGFTANIGMSSGDTRLTIGKDSTADVRFRGSSGQFVLTVATGQALRVEVRQVSSGDVNLPSALARVSGTDQEGVWQTAGYDSAANRVDLIIESVSSGTVKVQAGS